MNQTTKLSAKGRVILPRSLLASHRWKPGTELMIEDLDGGILLKPKVGTGARTWESLIGCARYAGPRRSVKEMDDEIAIELRSLK